jgi:hypothetical protein
MKIRAVEAELFHAGGRTDMTQFYERAYRESKPDFSILQPVITQSLYWFSYPGFRFIVKPEDETKWQVRKISGCGKIYRKIT